jgi:hypothetical protein
MNMREKRDTFKPSMGMYAFCEGISSNLWLQRPGAGSLHNTEIKLSIIMKSD